MPDDVPDEALVDGDGSAGAVDCEARGVEGAGVAGVLLLPGRLRVAMSAPRSSGAAFALPDDCAGAEGMGIRGESPTAGSGTPDTSWPANPALGSGALRGSGAACESGERLALSTKGIGALIT